MLPQPGLTTTTTRIPVDIRRFPWIRPLAADYAYDFARLAPFFAGNPAEPPAWREALGHAQQYPRDRAAIAEVIAAQQRRRGAPPETAAAAARLRDDRTVAVVTGQQAGLFGGPLYTLIKALSAVQLAERLAAAHQVPVVPVFWVDAEDHDWDEVRRCVVLDGELRPASVDAGAPAGAHQLPVARVRLDAAAAGAVDALTTTLAHTEFTPAVLDGLRAAYQPGLGMADAFARWLESVLGPRGLVVFDASDPAAKPLAASVFAREIEHAGETARFALDAGRRLEALGYHAQVTSREDHAALFLLNDGRHSIVQDGDGFIVGDSRTSREALVEQVRARPDQFSPNVLLRPLVQDTLFPTVAYVAGPSELAYLAQLREVYAAHGVPMPLIQPRASATVLDSNAMRFLGRQDVAFEALRAQDEAALNQLLEAQLPASVERALEETARAVADRLETLIAAVPQIDATLEGAARSTLGRMQDDLKKLHGKIIQAAKRKDETLRRQFTHARAQAFPGGDPQERAVGFVYFLNKYGPSLIDRLIEDLPLDSGTHWVLTI